jgi:hypothetical protein
MASTTFVMVLEGVIAGRDDDIELSQAMCDPMGQALYLALARVGRVVLCTKQNRSLVDHWCSVNGMRNHAAVYPLDAQIIRRMRAAGETPDLYIDWHSERAAQAVKDGVQTMLYVKPMFARAGFQRSDLPGLQRPFAAIIAEQAAQREARSRPIVDDD